MSYLASFLSIMGIRRSFIMIAVTLTFMSEFLVVQ